MKIYLPAESLGLCSQVHFQVYKKHFQHDVFNGGGGELQQSSPIEVQAASKGSAIPRETFSSK